VQSFTARMPLLTATSAFRLEEDAGVLLDSVIYIVSRSTCNTTNQTNYTQTAEMQPLVTNIIYTVKNIAFVTEYTTTTAWLSQYQKDKTNLDLNEARDGGVLGWQWHQLDRMQTICTSLHTDNNTNTSSLNFYRLDALPDAQPTVSKH